VVLPRTCKAIEISAGRITGMHEQPVAEMQRSRTHGTHRCGAPITVIDRDTGIGETVGNRH
jgi:hypothetical protein